MIAFSNKKFLILFAAMVVACSFVAVVDADNVRRRKLKSAKSDIVSRPAVLNNIVTSTTTTTINPPLVSNPVDVSEWGARCPNQENALSSCLVRGAINMDRCLLCIQGQANLSGTTLLGLRSCSNPDIGGFCEGCGEEVRMFFECGSGRTLGGTPVAGTPPATGGATGGGGGSDATPNVGSSENDFAPATSCPLVETLESGTSCEVPAPFKFQECHYPATKCTCRFDSPFWMCFAI